MSPRRAIVGAIAGLALAGCGATPAPRRGGATRARVPARPATAAPTPAHPLTPAHPPTPARPPAPARPPTPARPPASAATPAARARPAPRAPLRALVTAPQQDEVVEVDVPSGRIVRRLAVPGQPEYAATCCGGTGDVAIASPGNGTVTLAAAGTLRRERVLRGFGSPHIVGFAQPADDVEVTDDARGQLDVIALRTDRVIARVTAGAGAHHFATSPDGRQIWVALGQSAATIAVLSTVVSPPAGLSGRFENPGRPHLVGHFSPGFRAHQLLFTPDGRRVWITAADRSRVGVFDVRTRRPLFSVPAGAPPQHIAFAGRFAYITSGYGGRIEQVDRATGRVLRVAAAPYGSFELDAGGGYVVTSSLLRGTLAIYDASLRRLRVLRVAASAEDVVLSGG